MPATLDSLDNRLSKIETIVASFDFRITSIQLTVNQFEQKIKGLQNDIAALKKETISVTDDNTSVTLGQYLNGKEMMISG